MSTIMTSASSSPSASPVRRVLPSLLLLAAMLALFWDTASAMVGIWIRSETFTHAFLVPPIALWLVWRRRPELALLSPRAAPWVLVPMAGACLLWLMGELVGVNAATQFALVALIVMSVPAVFGLTVANAILFPLLFLFFAVPIGDFMVPQMIDWTADFTVAALRLTGIPVYREGTQFVIPTGNWSVVEACSGVRYLIASFMVGSLFAYLNYRSTRRRVVFMLVSIAVPIVANWLRAYLIVMTGHLSGNQLAVGADHLVYGWVFFGIIIMIMFMIGARWSEPDLPAPQQSPVAVPAPVSDDLRSWVVTGGVLGLLLATQAAIWQLNRPAAGPAPVLALPATLPGNWLLAGEPVADWKPAYQRPSAVAQAVYRSQEKAVAVWVGYYRDQSYQRKLVTSTNFLVDQESRDWAFIGGGSATLANGEVATRVRTAHLRQPADPNANARNQLDVAYLYWVGGRYTTSDVEAKLWLAFHRLLGRGDDAAVLIFYTQRQEGDRSMQALRGFVGQQLGPLGTLLAATAAAARGH